MHCTNCGEHMNDNQAICLKCGVKTGGGNSFCANCGNAVAPNAEICLGCGVSVKKSNPNYLNGKDKLTMALICFFLGGLGIHNFMMGETKKGVFKIVMSLFFIGGLFTLIDFVKIITDKYVVDDTKLI